MTVLLVTHLMEEAERLADRVAVFGEGRVVAIDTPAGIVSMVDPEQRLRFRPSVPVDDGLLTGLPEVRRVERTGPIVVVTGTGNLIAAVMAVLARHQIVANDLRVEQAEPGRRVHRAHRAPAGPHREGAVMNEFRALLTTEAKLLFRDPITWLAAIALPTAILLIFGVGVRAAPSPTRRSAVCGSSTCSCRR